MEYTVKTLPPKGPENLIRGIYMIKNSISGECYIGSSRDIVRRIRAHLSELRQGIHHSHQLQAAWDEYGAAPLRFRVVEIVESIEDLTKRENAAFALYLPTYNISLNAEANPMLGRRHTEESRAKMSAGKLGQPSGMKGKKMSEESREKMRIAATGRSNPSAKRPRTDDEKQNLSEKTRARFAGGPATNPRARAVEIDGVTYPTGKEAAIALGVSHITVIHRIKRGLGRYVDGNPTSIHKPKKNLTNY